tara:strand:- start:316 stop:579 length:264 start_codon:yes stop_codon:yes gene_type:complete
MNLTPLGVINTLFVNHTKSTISDKELITYYIHDKDDWNILNRYQTQLNLSTINNQIESGYEDRCELLMGFSESLENIKLFSSETAIS